MTTFEDTAYARLLEYFPGAELVEVDEDLVDDQCTWSACKVQFPEGALISIGERKDTWCLAHVSDDALPKVVSTDRGLRACTQCGQGTARMLTDGTPIHPGVCVRNMMAKRASGSKPKGAYARRRKG